MARITLAAARVNKGYTQMDAAKKLGVSVSTLKNWEKGCYFPKQPQIEKLCTLYGLTYDDIIFLSHKLALS